MAGGVGNLFQVLSLIAFRGVSIVRGELVVAFLGYWLAPCSR